MIAGLNPRELERIAAAYPEAAHTVPAWERERYFTPAQQTAWLLRFQPGCAELSGQMQEEIDHG